MHRIRLREPWTRTLEPQPAFSRQFNSPTGLGPEQRVELVIELRDSAILDAVVLNGEPLDAPKHALCRIEIRKRLLNANRLTLTFAESVGIDASSQPNLSELAEVHLAIADD